MYIILDWKLVFLNFFTFWSNFPRKTNFTRLNIQKLTKYIYDAVVTVYFNKQNKFKSQGLLTDCFSRPRRSNNILFNFIISDHYIFLIKTRSNNLTLKYRPFRLILNHDSKIMRNPRHVSSIIVQPLALRPIIMQLWTL